MSEDVYIVGVDMIKFGRFPERTVPDLGAEAALMALDDCRRCTPATSARPRAWSASGSCNRSARPASRW